MSKELSDILKSIAPRDVEALRSIYNYRCLTTEQIYQLHYMRSIRDSNEIVGDSYCKKKLSDFLEMEIVEKMEHMNSDVYFLTTKGVDIVKHCYDLPTNIFNYAKNAIRNGYYRAAELKISPKYINHQLSLNQFIIDFILKNYDVVWKYYDEKHLSQFSDIRPDGLLNMLDVDYFIEMDMATESKKQLYEKWENYRRFLDSQEFQFIERKIVVLFVVENTAKPQARIDLVKHTMSARLMDKLDSNFEIYVDTKENLIALLGEKIDSVRGDKRNEHDETFKNLADKGFSVAFGEKLKEHFNGIEYEFYCRKIDERNRVIVENGRLQEFLVDTYKYAPFSVLKKIAFLSVSNLHFKKKLKRTFSYVVIGESENLLFRDLKIMDLIVVDNVYYTTFERLKNRPFHQALFQFDFLGNVHTFMDPGLTERIFEKNVTGFLDGEDGADQSIGGNA